jgi:hypothetical protein
MPTRTSATSRKTSPKRAKVKRGAEEFDLWSLAARLAAPQSTSSGAYAPTLEEIRCARDAQLVGNFRLAVAAARKMGTDDAIAVARKRRLSPQRGLPVALVASSEDEVAQRVLVEAMPLYGPTGIAVTKETVADINGTLADHGIAIGVITTTPRADGRRVTLEVHEWPLEHVRWDPYARCLMTRTEDGCDEPIVHGDGRWVVFAGHERDPWATEDAAFLAASVNVWAVHAFGVRDMAMGSATAGNVKPIGEMPEGVDIEGPHGVAFLALLRLIASADSPYGLRPAGSKIDMLSSPPANWQIFQTLVEGREKAAARLYLGTDGTLGQTSGAPGVDLQGLFGVSNAIVEADLSAIERGIQTGVLEPWAAINFGDSRLAPRRRYLRPDADEAARHEAMAKRTDAFHRAIKEHKEAGFTVDEEAVAELAQRFGVRAPRLVVAVPKPVAPVAGAAPVAPPVVDVDADAKALADKMTAAGITHCPHERPNRCPLCRIEAVRDFVLDEAGEPVWRVKWRAIR